MQICHFVEQPLAPQPNDHNLDPYLLRISNWAKDVSMANYTFA
jgi:hypothetical protein